MASFEFSGFDELDAALARIGQPPDAVKEKALTAMAQAAAGKIKSQGEAMGVRDPESDEHILDTITVNKPKLNAEGGVCTITFKGTRSRGRKRVRNAEIAFVNEYGSRKQRARPFIGQAMTQNEKAIVDPGAEILGAWIEKSFKE